MDGNACRHFVEKRTMWSGDCLIPNSPIPHPNQSAAPSNRATANIHMTVRIQRISPIKCRTAEHENEQRDEMTMGEPENPGCYDEAMLCGATWKWDMKKRGWTSWAKKEPRYPRGCVCVFKWHCCWKKIGKRAKKLQFSWLQLRHHNSQIQECVRSCCLHSLSPSIFFFGVPDPLAGLGSVLYAKMAGSECQSTKKFN